MEKRKRRKKELTPEQQEKKKKRKKRRKIILLTITGIIVIGVGTLSIMYAPTISKLYKESKEIIATVDESDFKQNTPSSVYNKNGEEIMRLNGDIEVQYTEYKYLPQDLVDAVISYEDKRFYEHKGVDYKGLFRAGFAYIKNKGNITQGGSTLTQQVVKRTFLTPEQTWERKVKEMFIAKDLEKKFSKEDIIEFYVNNIYYGNNCYGIKSASMKYFGKELKDLTLSECAFLSVVPNNPEGLNPYNYLGKVIVKRDIALKYMLEQGYITDEEYKTAIKEEIKLVDKNKVQENSKYNSLEGLITNDLAKIIAKKQGFEFKYSFKNDAERKSYEENYENIISEIKTSIYTKGYKVYTSIDMNKQSEIQKMLDEQFSNNTTLTNEGKYALQSSVTVIDNETGLIVSAIGGRTSPKTDYVNRTYQVYRQNGSAMKPLAVYTPAFEEKFYPFSVINDSKVENGPSNSTGYRGDVPIRYAVEISSNTVADKVFKDITPKYGISFLQNMEFNKIVDSDFNASFALGGMTLGTNTNEMAGAYSTLARNGSFISPTTIEKVTTLDGNLYYENIENKSKQIYKDSSAYLMTDVLKGVITDGTAKGYGLANGIASAGKTGSTDEYKDIWFAGYSPKYTTVVWVGYDNPKRIEGNYLGSRLQLWQNIMNYLHQGMSNLDFARPESVTEINVNWKGELVPEGYSNSHKELVPIDRLPSEEESIRNQQTINSITGQIEQYISANPVTNLEKYEEVCNKSQALLNTLLEKENSSYVKNSLNTYLLNRLNGIGTKLKEKLLPKVEIKTENTDKNIDNSIPKNEDKDSKPNNDNKVDNDNKNNDKNTNTQTEKTNN